ncbi:MAG: hypothetical protein KatS3mg033_0036 [Thermonema sp.]|uniref:S8 family peptidase n=1 Tax=Thermonema sp. TaxID=2231181 RepID=UPI0021DD2A41|nr:S8 family peptidase [Thermonema sp.]GIV38236.1 MAG: hypothetical protein KatS3mg033_0036 [Thermonema sp.]
MNKRNLFTAAGLAAFLAASCLTGCKQQEETMTPAATPDVQQVVESGDAYEGRYIVVFKDEAAATFRSRIPAAPARREGKLEYARRVEELAREEVSRLLAEVGIQRDKSTLDNVYGHVFLGFADQLSAEELRILRQDSRVAIVEPDRPVFLEPVEVKESTNAAQSTPWGITRVGGAVESTGLSRWAFVIDSGIDLDHPDLNVNTQYSRSFVGGSADDANGHGTHVAGTIAAKNNSYGVVGVAAGATVVSVRVFGASGQSSNATIINGVDYTAGVVLQGDVVNMSLGGGASTSIDNAVKNLASKGVYVAVAAGNDAANSNYYSPARVNYYNSSNGGKVLTVSAMDSRDRYASFSNYANPPIDVCAPGVSIYSTYKGGGYATLSGTSMATPHIAGIMLVNNGKVYIDGYVKNDPDGKADPIGRR